MTEPPQPWTSPKRLRSARLVRGFTRYARWYVRRNVHAVRISRDGLPEAPRGRPLVIFANHPSWWDPLLFILLLDRFFPKRPAYGPMDAESLQKYGFMRRLGIFGVEREPIRGAVQFLATGEELLDGPDAVLVITAQGRFADVRERPVKLLPGIAHLARRCPSAVLLPLALDYVFWDERYPEVLVRFGPPVPETLRDPKALLPLLERQLEAAMDRLAADAIRRSPDRFVLLLEGSVGIGGPYDLWRRLRATLAGRRFIAGHGAR